METTKTLLLLVFSFIFNLFSNAQFKSATIGVDGLTCSACSYSTEMSIRKLDFVDSVFMELDKNIATVFFKEGKPILINQLAQKVVDAGFAVRSIYAVFKFDNLLIKNNLCYEHENNIYQFINIKDEKTLNGFVSVQFIGKEYMQKKEFKKWQLLCNSDCKKETGATVLSPQKNQFYITLQ